MATTSVRKVPVTLGGEERHLIFDMNSHAAFEDVMGHTLIEAIAAIKDDFVLAHAQGRPPKMPQVKMIRALLWAGLRSETLDEDGNETATTLSLHQVGKMLDFGEMMAVLESIGEAAAVMLNGLPEPKGNPQKAPQRKGSRSTSRRSGASR